MNEEQAREILGEIVKPDNSLQHGGQYIFWRPGEDTACLDADFTAEELEAIAWWMQNHVL